jgi:DNA modification methylase
MQIEKIEVGRLRAAAYNPRKDLKPGDAEFEKLRKSIEEFGYVEPIIVNRQTGFTVVGGHQRLKVLRHLGQTEVDCVIVDLDEQKEKALNIALNKISGAWEDGLLTALLKDLSGGGYDISITGFDAAEVAELFGSGSLENVHEDDFDAEEAEAEIVEPITRNGDIWLLGRHRLLCGDSTKQDDVTRIMGDKLADLVVTDPPYNVNYGKCVAFKEKNGHKNVSRESSNIANDNMSDGEFYEFLLAFYTAAYGVMKGGASIYVFHSTKETLNFTKAMTDARYKVSQMLVWVKNHFTLGRQSYQWMHEPILFGWKEADGCKHYFIDDRTNASVFDDGNLDFKKLTKDELRTLLEKVFALQTDVIRDNKPLKSVEHPTMKPITLCAKLIYNSSRENEIVYEPFCGSGSTLIAAEQLNSECRSIELDPKYCDVITKRFRAAFPNQEVRLLRNGKELTAESVGI